MKNHQDQDINYLIFLILKLKTVFFIPPLIFSEVVVIFHLDWDGDIVHKLKLILCYEAPFSILSISLHFMSHTPLAQVPWPMYKNIVLQLMVTHYLFNFITSLHSQLTGKDHCYFYHTLNDKVCSHFYHFINFNLQQI